MDEFLHQAVGVAMRGISVMFAIAAAGFLIVVPVVLFTRERSKQKNNSEPEK